MAWLKIDDGFNENPKIERLRDRAFRVHVSALVYCAKNLTDGHISTKSAKVIGILVGFPVKRHLPELVDAGLWTPDSQDGHWINDYLTYNPTAVEVRASREKNAERQRRHRNGEHNALRNGTPVVPVPARPEKNLKAVPADQEKEHEVDKIMRSLARYDDNSRDVIASYARKLPLATIARIREMCQLKRVGAGYVVNALQAELAALEEVA